MIAYELRSTGARLFCYVMWSHNKGVVGGRTSCLRAINFCL